MTLVTIGDFKQQQWNPYHGPRLLKLGHLGEQGYLQRILSLIKTNFELNTYPGLKKWVILVRITNLLTTPIEWLPGAAPFPPKNR